MTALQQKLIQTIQELPEETLHELDDFIGYLQYKKHKQSSAPDKAFLFAIMGIGESDETDLSVRDEEILAQEIDPIRGWTFNKGSHQ